MKKITFLSGITLVTGLMALLPRASAQITITQSDLPSIGLRVVTDSDGVSNPNPGLANSSSQNWDFSGLQRQKAKTVVFMAPSSTPYASTFSAANLADSTYGGNGYNFFNTSASNFSVEGAEENQYVSAASTNLKIEINLVPEFEQASLPATYGNVVSGVAKGSQTFAVTFSFVISGERFTTNINYSDTVDAWGTMKMPNGKTYNVLRQKHHEVDIDSVYLDNVISGWAYYERIITNKNQYDWYTNGVGYILAEEDMSTTFDTIVDVIWDTTAPFPTAIPQISIKNNVNVYPNPANNQINFVTGVKEDAYILIYDLTGRELEKVAVKNGMSTLNTNAYNNGVYLYSLTDNSGNLIDRGKFIIQH